MLTKNIFIAILAMSTPAIAQPTTTPVGNVVFLHVDGTSINHWSATRMLHYGPDGNLQWDSLPSIGVYRGHMSDLLNGTSHGAATVHAYGVKVKSNSYGMNGTDTISSPSGRGMSVAREALASGIRVGIINSGTITEPGSGAFLASVPNRNDHEAIAAQIIASNVTLILGGGEKFFLPRDAKGRHAKGVRRDNQNLIELARRQGYTVIYTRDELLALPSNTKKVLGLFAADHTFNDKSEEELKRRNLPLYEVGTPTIAEMVSVALRVLGHDNNRFFLVAEEEGSDNFANANNAAGTLEATKRGDDAVGVIRRYINEHPSTLLLTAADSDAGGLGVAGVPPGKANEPLPDTTENGSPVDGVNGTGSLPFLAAADNAGMRLPFAVTWSSTDDLFGAILVRAQGFNARDLPLSVDNTGIYRLMFQTLFGRAATHR